MDGKVEERKGSTASASQQKRIEVTIFTCIRTCALLLTVFPSRHIYMSVFMVYVDNAMVENFHPQTVLLSLHWSILVRNALLLLQRNIGSIIQYICTSIILGKKVKIVDIRICKMGPHTYTYPLDMQISSCIWDKFVPFCKYLNG